MYYTKKQMTALLGAFLLPLFAAGAQAQHLAVQEVPLTTNHILYDSINQKVYASIPGTAALHPNTIAQINAASGAVESYIPVGSNPDVLALSGDGSYLYVGIDGTSSVARINLASNVVDQQFSLPTSSLSPQYPYHAGNIVPLPGMPQSIAVTRDYFGLSPANDGVAIYDNGVQRPNSLSRGTNIYASLTDSNSSTRLYSFDNESSGYTFAQLNLDANGVTVGQTSDSFGTGILAGYNVAIKFDPGNGLIYATNGKVVDPVALTDVGTYTNLVPGSPYAVAAADVVPDHQENRVYFLLNSAVASNSPATLAAYNQSTFQPISTYTTSGSYGSVSDLYEISPTKFVFRSSQGIELVSPQSLSSLTITAAASTVAAGKTDQFTATAAYGDGSTSDATGTATWSSDNTATARINSAGLAKAGTSGTAHITAALGGILSNPVALIVTPALYQVLWNNIDGQASLWNYDADHGTYTHQEYGPYPGWTAKTLSLGGSDGLTRVLWDKTDGTASLWSLNSNTGVFSQFSYGPYPGWTASSLSVSSSNINHLLWNNSDGRASLWNEFFDSFGSFSQVTSGSYPSWTAKAAADGPDGLVRTLWDNADGSISIPGAFGSPVLNAFGPYPGWTANALSVGADNTTHILWDNVDGRLSLWNYSVGSTVFTQNTYGPYPGWSAKAIADSSDGKTLVMWDNINGQLSLWSLDNTTGSYTHAEFGPFSGWTATAVAGGI